GHALTELLPSRPASTRASAEHLLNQARRLVNERVRQQADRVRRRVENMVHELGLLTAQLQGMLDVSQIPAILAEHLPHLAISQLLAAQFVPDDDDPVAQSTWMLSYGVDGATSGQHFVTRQFPPLNLYRPDRPFQLALLPLVVPE